MESAFPSTTPATVPFPEASAPLLLLTSGPESLKVPEQPQEKNDFDSAPAAAPVTPVTPVISKQDAFPSQPVPTSPSAAQSALSYQERVALATQEQLTKVEGNDIQSRLLRQVEFYFSDTNLPRDKFLKHLLGIPVSGDSPKPAGEAAPESPIIPPEDYKYVPLEILLGFNKIKALTEDMEVLRAAIKKSAGLIEMNADETGVRRTIPLPEKPPKDKKKRRKNKLKTKGEGEAASPVDTEGGSPQPSKPTSTATATLAVQTPPAASSSTTQSTSAVQEATQPAKPAPAQPLSPADELEMRTVIAECLPQGYTKNDVDRDFCKYGPIESIELEEAQSSSGRGGLAYIIYKNVETAQRAVCDLETATKGGTVENDWRRQLIRVKSKKDYLVNKNVNTRYRRNSIAQAQAQTSQHSTSQYGGHGSAHYYGPSYVSGENNRYRYPPANYQHQHHQHQPQIPDPIAAASAFFASLHAKQPFEGSIPQSLEAMLKLSSLSPLSPLPATSPVSPLDTPHSPFPTGGQQYNQQRRKSEDHRRNQPRRMSVSNVVTPGYVSLAQQASVSVASPASAPSGHNTTAGVNSSTTSPGTTADYGAGPSSPLQASALPFVRRNSLSETLQRNRLMSQHGILSIHSTTGAIQEDFRVVYPRGPDSSKGFVRAVGRGKPR